MFIERLLWMVELNDISVQCRVCFSGVLKVRLWLRIGLLYLFLFSCRKGVFGVVWMKLFWGQMLYSVGGLLVICLLIRKEQFRLVLLVRLLLLWVSILWVVLVISVVVLQIEGMLSRLVLFWWMCCCSRLIIDCEVVRLLVVCIISRCLLGVLKVNSLWKVVIWLILVLVCELEVNINLLVRCIVIQQVILNFFYFVCFCFLSVKVIVDNVRCVMDCYCCCICSSGVLISIFVCICL